MLKTFTLLLGAVLLVVGLVGTFTGGHNHELIVFGINTTHNIVHILSGIVGIAAALLSLKAAKTFCLLFGLVYGAVAVAGFAGFAPVVDMLYLNTADNFLHLAIAATCLYFGATSKV